MAMEILNELEVREFKRFLTVGLYQDAFDTLSKKYNSLSETGQKMSLISDFFEKMVFTESVYKNLSSKKDFNQFVEGMMNFFENGDRVQKQYANVFGDWMADFMNDFWKSAMQSENLKLAERLLPFIEDKNIEKGWIDDIDDAIQQKKLKSFIFLVENCEKSNLHYDNDQLVRSAFDLNMDAVSFLVDKYDFNINKVSPISGSNVIHDALSKDDVFQFKELLKRFSSKIDYSVDFVYNGQYLSFFDLINQNSSPIECYSALLEQTNISHKQFDVLCNILLKDFNVINLHKKELINSSIYHKLFSHPLMENKKFDDLHLPYFLIKNCAIQMNSLQGMEDWSLHLLDAFIDTRKNDIVPPTGDDHIITAVSKMACFPDRKPNGRSYVSGIDITEHDKNLLKIYDKFLDFYQRYVPLSIPNDNQINAINQFISINPTVRLNDKEGNDLIVEKLIKKGCKKIGFFSRGVPFEEPKKISKNKLTEQVTEDYQKIVKNMNVSYCDPEIRTQMENMFIRAESVSNFIENNKFDNLLEEIHSIRSSFSRYIEPSVNSYLQVAEVHHQLNSKISKEKANEAKTICLKHIYDVTETLDYMEKTLVDAKANRALSDLQVQTIYLQNKKSNMNAQMQYSMTQNDEQVNIREEKDFINTDEENLNNLNLVSQQNIIENIKEKQNKKADDDVMIDIFADEPEPEKPRKLKM